MEFMELAGKYLMQKAELKKDRAVQVVILCGVFEIPSDFVMDEEEMWASSITIQGHVVRCSGVRHSVGLTTPDSFLEKGMDKDAWSEVKDQYIP